MQTGKTCNCLDIQKILENRRNSESMALLGATYSENAPDAQAKEARRLALSRSASALRSPEPRSGAWRPEVFNVKKCSKVFRVNRTIEHQRTIARHLERIRPINSKIGQ
jgi:hypothetical protein